jgi:hypothetical protein
MRIRTDGDYEWRKGEIETAADWWGCNKTAALLRSAEAVRDLDDGIRSVLERDDLTTEQKREIAAECSGRNITYEVDEEISSER